jgi:hypothetical protein
MVYDFNLRVGDDKTRSALKQYLRDKDFDSEEDLFKIIRLFDCESTDTIEFTRDHHGSVSRIARHPLSDPEYEYRTWYYAIPRRLHNVIPSLKMYPMGLNMAMARIQEGEARALFGMLYTIMQSQEILGFRHDTSYKKYSERIHVIAASKAMTILINHLPAARGSESRSNFKYSTHIYPNMTKNEMEQVWSDLIRVAKPCRGVLNDVLGKFVKMMQTAIKHAKLFHNIKEPVDWDTICIKSEYIAPIPQKADQTIYTSEDVDRVNQSEMSPKMKLVMALLSGPALRSVGVRHLLIENLYDIENKVPFKYVKCKEKFGSDRGFGLKPQIMVALGVYMKLHKKLSRYLFPCHDDISCDEPIPYSVLNYAVMKVFEKAGVIYRGMHKFRHWRIGDWMDKGAPIEEVSKLMGHKSINTTYGYWRPDPTVTCSKFDRLEQHERPRAKSLDPDTRSRTNGTHSGSSPNENFMTAMARIQWYERFIDHVFEVGRPIRDRDDIQLEFEKDDPDPGELIKT